MPYDWPPLYYLMMAGWRELVGINPVALRYFSVLVGLFGAASMYRLGLRMFSHGAALLIAAVYAALGFGIFLSLMVRAHIFVYALFPLVMLLTLRYFDRPTTVRGGAVGLGLAAMFYINFTSAIAFAALGLYTVVMFPAGDLALVAPGERGICARAADHHCQADPGRVHEHPPRARSKCPRSFRDFKQLLVTMYMGNAPALWVGLFVLATALAILARRRLDRTQALFLIAWPVLGAVLLYVLNPLLGFFSPRYAWWIMIGLALWIGLGLSLMPPRGQSVALVLVGAIMFLPLPVTRYHEGVPRSPLILDFEWLRDHLMPNDVLILDPNLDVAPEAWDYFERVYFPHGLPVVREPGTYSRVWYATHDYMARSAAERRRSARSASPVSSWGRRNC